MRHREIKYENFGRCIALSDGVTELYMTLDIGPRIIYFGRTNGENLLGTLTDFDLSEPTDDVFKVFGDLGVWHSFGGHRLWAAPEEMPRTYFPDNRPCRHEVSGDTLYIYQMPQPYTQLELSMEVTFLGGGEVEVRHKIKNIGPFEKRFAPWAITIMEKGGVLAAPVRQDGPRYLPNRFFSFWTYSCLSDKRFRMSDKFIYIEQTDEPRPFKMGMANAHGFAAYFNKGDVFVKYFDYEEGAQYPDNGMNFEAYTNNKILEIESLGGLQTVPPYAFSVHTERWRIIPDTPFPGFDDDKIENILLH